MANHCAIASPPVALIYGHMSPPTPRVGQDAVEPDLIPTLRRFLPYLWPPGHPGLKARLVLALALVLVLALVRESLLVLVPLLV